MTTVVIVDDHPIVRAGMRTVLNAAGDITVVAEGASGTDALRLVAEYRPDVLVLDVNLPDINGVEVTRQLRDQFGSPQTQPSRGHAAEGEPPDHETTRPPGHPTTRILVLTVHSDNETVFGILESGATGYVLKDEALETLVSAVRAAARGESWLSPAVARQVVRRAIEPAPAISTPAPLPLTPREIEVLCLLAQGLDNTAIAERLVVTTRTVQNHVSAIYGKLGVTSRTEAALIAIRHGLIRVPPAEGTSE